MDPTLISEQKGETITAEQVKAFLTGLVEAHREDLAADWEQAFQDELLVQSPGMPRDALAARLLDMLAALLDGGDGSGCLLEAWDGFSGREERSFTRLLQGLFLARRVFRPYLERAGAGDDRLAASAERYLSERVEELAVSLSRAWQERGEEGSPAGTEPANPSAGLPAPALSGRPALDARPVLEQMAGQLMAAVGAHSSFLYLVTPRDELFLPYLCTGRLPTAQREAFFAEPLDPATDLLAYEILHKQAPWVSYSPAADPRLSASVVDRLGLKSVFALPLLVERQLFGMLLFGNPHTTPPFRAEGIDLAVSIAGVMGLALDHLRLYEEAQRRLQESQGMHHIGLALLQKLDLEDVLEIVCTEARRLTNAAGSSVSLLESEHWLRIVYQTGEAVHPGTCFPVNSSLLGMAVRRGETVLINNRFPEKTDADVPAPFSLLAIPLRVKGEMIGVLDVVNKVHGFSTEDVRLIDLFANQAAIAIEHARLYREVEKMAVLEERQRLARELHDSVNQSLYGIALYSEAACRQLVTGELEAVGEHLQMLATMAKEALDEMRLLIFELRPPILEQQGLEAAIRERLKAVEARTGLMIGFKDRLNSRLPGEIEEALYRIAQEGLNNVLKHAQATRVSVHLIQSGQVLVFKIQDDGAGFDVAAAQECGGMGLKMMRERAASIGAELRFESQPGSGTTLLVEVHT